MNLLSTPKFLKAILADSNSKVLEGNARYKFSFSFSPDSGEQLSFCSQATLCVVLAVAVFGLAAAAGVTETAPGASGVPITYTVIDGAYNLAASSVGIEADYTTSTNGSSTTFTFLVSD